MINLEPEWMILPHLLEMALAGSPISAAAFKVRLEALRLLLARAYKNGKNFSEVGWLKARNTATEKDLTASS